MSGSLTSSNILTAQQFLGTIGVDTHIAYTDGGYANVQNFIADLQYLGIDQIRDGISNGENGSAPLSSYIKIAQAGIKFAFIIDVSSTAALNATLSLINQVAQAVPGSVIAIEGPNEINNEPVTYNGVSGLQGALAEQADLYAAVHSDPFLPGVPVYYFTGYGAGGIAQGPNPSATPGLADYDTQHPYPNNAQAPARYVARSVALSNENPATGPAVFTETGYTTNQVNADVQAKYELDLLMDTASEGISKTFLYELMDAYSPGSPQGDAGYGLFDYTTAPKEVAVALRNLTTLLQDTGAASGSFIPNAYSYSLTGLPSTGLSIALEKSDGTNIISVWNEPQIWNTDSNTEIAVSVSQVTVNLDASYASVQVFDPLVGISAIATYTNVSSVTIGVTDHPILVEFSGAAPTTTQTAPVTTPTTPVTTPTTPVTTPIVTTPVTTPTSPVTTPAGGSDALVLNVGEAPAGGQDAQFTVSVDGTQIGGVQTVAALQKTGATQNITLTGSFGSGSHIVTIDYLNGFTGNPLDAGRTLYLNAITLDNVTNFTNGQFAYDTVSNYSLNTPSPAIASNAGSADTLVLNLAEAAVGGQDAQFMVSVDGQIVGGLQTVTASYAAGQSQNVTLTGDFGSGAHSVAVNFINGFTGAPADIGRQLYVNAITLDGAVTAENSAQAYAGSQTYQVAAGTSTTPVVTTPVVTTPVVTTPVVTTPVVTTPVVTTPVVTTPVVTTPVVTTPVITTPVVTTPTNTSVVTLGSGPDTLALQISEDAYLGDAQFTIAVNGVQIGGTQTATASYAAGASQIFDVMGNFSGQNIVTLDFLNDAYGGTPQTDRNFYETGATIDGAVISGAALTELSQGPMNFAFQGPTTTPVVTTPVVTTPVVTTPVVTTPIVTTPIVTTPIVTTPVTTPTSPVTTPTGGSDALVLNVGEAPAGGQDAQFTVSVDGTQIGGVQTVTALQKTGATQNITLTGSFGSGSHIVTIDYLNGFTGNPLDAGRTLYLNAITLDNVTNFTNGQFAYDTVSNYSLNTPSPAIASNAGSADTLVLNIAEAAVGGQDAQFMVSVDGQIVGGLQTVTASYAAGQSQNVTLTGDFGSGAHSVTVNFINGFTGAPADIGRQLYVNAITLDGAVTAENSAQSYAGSQTYQVVARASAQAGAIPGASAADSPTSTQDLTYDSGDGAVDIHDADAASAVLHLGAGLSPANISLAAGASGALIITDGLAGDSVTIDGMLGAAGSGISQMQFIDGTVWTGSQMTFTATTATSVADTIIGTAGNDIIDGRGGRDTVFGEGGDDTYIFRQGYGSLQINNLSATGTAPAGELDLGAGLTENNLWFSRNGGDLDIEVLNSTDQVVVQGWFDTNVSARLSDFIGGDGLKLDTGLSRLVSAMATYQSANSGFDPTVAAAMPTDSALQSAILAAWHQ